MPSKGHHLLMGHRLHRRLCRWRLNTRGARNSSPIRPPSVHFTAATAAQSAEFVPRPPRRAPRRLSLLIARRARTSAPHPPLPMCTSPRRPPRSASSLSPVGHTDHPVVRRSSSRAERALRDPGSSAGTLSAHFIPRPPHLSRRPPSRASLLVVHRADRIPQPLCAQRRAALLMLRRTSRAQRLHRFLFN